MEQRSRVSGEGVGSAGTRHLDRTDSEPPLPVSRPVVVSQQQPLFASLRQGGRVGREAVAARLATPLNQSLEEEEEEDYVIIERTHSSSGSRYVAAVGREGMLLLWVEV